MKDNWINHNTDKLLLFALVVMFGLLVMHMVHHQVDHDSLTWAENSFSTVLGALILILTGRIQRSDGQTANGISPTPAALPPATSQVSQLATPEAQNARPAGS